MGNATKDLAIQPETRGIDDGICRRTCRSVSERGWAGCAMRCGAKAAPVGGARPLVRCFPYYLCDQKSLLVINAHFVVRAAFRGSSDGFTYLNSTGPIP